MKKKVFNYLIALAMMPMTVWGSVNVSGNTDSGEIRITTVDELVNAIRNQQDGQKWVIESGVYDIADSIYSKPISHPINGQTNFIFPIYANNLSITGEGDVLITSSFDPHSVSGQGGNWNNQNFVTVDATGVSIDNIDFKGNHNGYYDGCNKVIELIDGAADFTIRNSELKPLADSEKKVSSGSIYVNVSNPGTVTIENVRMYSWINARPVSAGTVNVVDVVQDFRNNVYAGYSTPEYGYAWNPGISGTQVSVKNFTVYVDNNIKLEEQIFTDKLRDGTRIELSEGEYLLDRQLVIKKAVTLNGAGVDRTIIKPGSNWKGSSNSENNLVTLQGLADVDDMESWAEGSYITVSNLNINDSKRSGLNVYEAPAVISNVKMKNNAAAGMVVQSKVKASGIITEGNAWGGVNVDKRSTGHNTRFAFDEASVMYEKNKVWSELENASDIVTAPEGWRNYTGEGFCFWTNEKEAPEGQVNVIYNIGGSGHGDVKVSYDGKPAAVYTNLPVGKTVTLKAYPLVGSKLGEDGIYIDGNKNITTYVIPEGIETLVINAVFEEEAEVVVPEEEEAPVVKEEITEGTVVNNPTVVASEEHFEIPESVAGSDVKIQIVSEQIKEEEEVVSYVNAVKERFANASVDVANTVIYDITPVVISDDKIVGKAEVSKDEGVSLALPYPAGMNKSDLESVKVYHFAMNGEVKDFDGVLNENYILITGVESFSPFVMTYTESVPSVVVTYHDLYITESVGAKLVSRHGKDRTPDGGSFTLSLEKEAGYENCNPTVFYKRGRFDEWKELKIDEVSGYYQIRNVYTDIYVKVSGDGIWGVSNEEMNVQDVKIYSRNGSIVVNTPSVMDVNIVSIGGLQVATGKVAGQREFNNLTKGIYIVRAGEKVVKVRVD